MGTWVTTYIVGTLCSMIHIQIINITFVCTRMLCTSKNLKIPIHFRCRDIFTRFVGTKTYTSFELWGDNSYTVGTLNFLKVLYSLQFVWDSNPTYLSNAAECRCFQKRLLSHDPMAALGFGLTT